HKGIGLIREFPGWRKLSRDEGGLTTRKCIGKARQNARMVWLWTGPGDPLLLQALVRDARKRWGQRHNLLPDVLLRRIRHGIPHAPGQIGNNMPVDTALSWWLNGFPGQLHTRISVSVGAGLFGETGAW